MDSETWLDRAPTKAQLRSLFLKETVKHIADGGGSSHSGMGTTLPLLLRRLEQAKVSYQLTAHPGIGYYVQGIKREDWVND